MSITERIRYGAAELKEVYNRNLGIALGLSVGFHLALIFLYIFGLNVGKTKDAGNKPPVSRMRLSTIAPPPQQPDAPPPPPPPMIPPAMQGGGGGGGVASRAGTPVAVPDALIDPKLKDFATTQEIQVAQPEGGDGTGFGPKTDGSGLGTAVELPKNIELEKKDELPSINEFIDVSEEAKWSREELQRRIQYPDVAKRAGIQGTVIVRALVDISGTVRDVVVDQSDNKVLEKAAVDAVKKTPFTAALQGNKPVATWVQVDVVFKLE